MNIKTKLPIKVKYNIQTLHFEALQYLTDLFFVPFKKKVYLLNSPL